MENQTIRLGTRGSKLALIQTDLVSNALRKVYPGISLEVVEIKTLGDKKQGTPEASNSDKKDWVIDLELAILSGEIDLAIHSGKDVPGDIEDGTEISSVLERANPFDAFIGESISETERLSFADLPPNAVVGTASLRRAAALQKLRPDIRVVEHRGNVQTRLDKLDNLAEVKGIILACAGLERLELNDLRYDELSAEQMLPALNQGTLAVQYSSQRADIKELVGTIIDQSTQAGFLAERACAQVIGGDCQSAIGIFATCSSAEVSLSAAVMSHDGSEAAEFSTSGGLSEAAQIGRMVGEQLLERGAAEIIAKCSSG